MKIGKIKEKIELDDQFDVRTEACWNDCTIYRGSSYEEFKLIRAELGFPPIDLEGPKLFQAIEVARSLHVPNCFGYRNASGNSLW